MIYGVHLQDVQLKLDKLVEYMYRYKSGVGNVCVCVYLHVYNHITRYFV